MLKKKVGGFSRLPCKIFVLKGLPFFVKCLDVHAMVSAKQCCFVDSKHLKDSSLVILTKKSLFIEKSAF